MKKNRSNLLFCKKETFIVSIVLAGLIVLTALIVFWVSGFDNECNHSYLLTPNSIAASEFCIGKKHWECRWCKDSYTEKELATVNLPQLYLNGSTEGLSKVSHCLMSAEYYDGDTIIKNSATIKYQGHTSMLFPKKNYTIKFCQENNEGKKQVISVNRWEPTHKYCLKANYIDFSSSRNIVSSHIWSEVVANRETLDENINELEFKGGIDGYPIALFINDEYQGIYTFNISKDEDTYNIADEENEAMFVINSAFSDAANFKGLLTEEDKASVYDLEYTYPENSTWAYDSVNQLIDFVIKNDGDAFRKGIHKYLDVDAAIDYLITAYVLGMTDNFSKNMILLTYDGVRWIPNMYDLDTAAGLVFDGTGYLAYDFSLPFIDSNSNVNSGTDNLLWDKLLNNFKDDFVDRYLILRDEVLNTEKIIGQYCKFIDSIPKACYEQEKILYPNSPHNNVSQKEQITLFFTSRCEALDAIIANIDEVKK